MKFTHAGLLLGSLGCITSVTSHAARGDDEITQHISFVRDGQGKIVFEDWQFARDIQARTGVKFGSVDIVMQQCYSGGFLNDVAAMKKAGKAVPHTFASSAGNNEISWSLQNKQQFNYGLMNFTREWRLAARNDTTRGMKAIFDRARDRDIFGPVSTDYSPPVKEHLQYDSDSAASDNRRLGDAANNGPKQFAILAAFGKAQTRHAVNIARMKETLVNTYGVAPNQILSMYNQNGGTALPVPGGKIDPDDTNPNTPLNFPNSTYLTVNDNNTRAAWLRSLDRVGQPVQSGGADNLLVYVTGLGSQAYYKQIVGSTQPDRERYEIHPDPNAAKEAMRPQMLAFGGAPPAGGEMAATANPQMMGDHDGDFAESSSDEDHVQVSFNQSIASPNPNDPPTQLLLNGTAVNYHLVSSLNDVLQPPDHDASNPAPALGFTYEFDINRSDLLALPDEFRIDVVGLPPSALSADALTSFDIRAGEFETMFVNQTVPEPVSAGLFSIFGIGLLARSRRA